MTSVSPTACLPHRASRTSNWELRNRESVLPFLRLKRREPNQGVSRRSNVSQHDDSGLAYRGSLLTVRVQTASAGLKARMPATPTRRLLPTLGATGPRVPSPTVRVATTSYRAPAGHDQRKAPAPASSAHDSSRLPPMAAAHAWEVKLIRHAQNECNA